MIGLSRNQVTIHPYSEEWPRLFDDEKRRVESVIGNHILDIQHVGSTAVPGLAAKPILDIGVAVANFEEARRCIEPLASLGYIYRGENGIPRRHFFRKGDPATVHLHMNEVESDDWRIQIAFRDALRHNPVLAAEYGYLKQELARTYPNARQAYTESKGGFISKVLCQALPDLFPKAGQQITVRAFKADGTCYRYWQSQVVAATDELIQTESEPGHEIWDIKGAWIGRYAIRTFYWLARPYSLLEITVPETGQLNEIYVNIGSPPRFKDGELHFTDYELDVVRLPGQNAKLVDEDEFAEAGEKFGYTAGFKAYCYQAAQEALTLAEQWEVDNWVSGQVDS